MAANAEVLQEFWARSRREFLEIERCYPDIQRWTFTHNTGGHPGGPEDCDDCMETVARVGGIMPPSAVLARAETLLWRFRDPERTEISYLRQKWDGGKARWTRLILQRDGHACRVCGSTSNLTVDHIVPISLRGETNEENLWTLCKFCNSRKGDRPLPYQLNIFSTGRAAVARGI